MKKTFVMCLTLVFAMSAIRLQGAAAGCKAESWNPEIYMFYGDKDIVANKVDKQNMRLQDRRMFLQVTEGAGKMEVKLFERVGKADQFNVYTWTGGTVKSLNNALERAIYENKGVNCVGEQVKAILQKELPNLKQTEDVSAPKSPAAAFRHSLKNSAGEFIKTAIYLLC